MAYIPTETKVTTVSLTAQIWATSIVAIRTFSAWRRAANTKKALAELSPDRLQDIGHVESPQPVLTIKPGLMANLMSMR